MQSHTQGGLAPIFVVVFSRFDLEFLELGVFLQVRQGDGRSLQSSFVFRTGFLCSSHRIFLYRPQVEAARSAAVSSSSRLSLIAACCLRPSACQPTSPSNFCFQAQINTRVHLVVALMPPKLHEAPSNQQRVVAEGKVQRYFPKVRPEFAKSRTDDDAGDVRIGERRNVPAVPSGKALVEPAIELDFGRRVKAKAEVIQGEVKEPTQRFKAQIVKEDSDDEDADAAQRRRDAMRRQAGYCSFCDVFKCVFVS